jgi:hypothetical protein
MDSENPATLKLHPAAAAFSGNHGAGPKVRATLYLPADLLDEIRDAASYLAGYPARMTLTKLAEHAFRRELQRLKEIHHNGTDFPQRTEELKGGRPLAA